MCAEEALIDRELALALAVRHGNVVAAMHYEKIEHERPAEVRRPAASTAHAAAGWSAWL
jgi:hypothetical protein